jgi:Domain of unknown function (DUF4145)
LSPKLVELFDRRLSRLREAHGSYLLDESNTALKSIDVGRPASVTGALEELLRLTGVALNDYCSQLRSEIDVFLGSALPTLTPEDRDVVLRITAEHMDSELYLTRFDKFGEAIERHFGRAGRQVNMRVYRLNLLRARQHAGAANGVSRFLGVLRDDLDLRILAATPATTMTLEAAQSPSPSMKRETPLSSTARSNLLLELFREAVAPRFVVDKRTFRATRHEYFGTLDEMVATDDIRDNQGFYSATLLALSELSADLEVRQLLDDCGVVLQALGERYLDNQVDLIATDQLAKLAGLERGRFDRALTYLNENVSLLGGAQQGTEGPLQMVLPAEKVLDWKTVHDVLAELREYRRLRSSWTGLPLESAAAEPSTPAYAVIEERKWLQYLPDDVRAVLAETYAAQRIDLRALVLMGVRAAIDMTCNHLVGDLGNFDKKLAALRSSGFISDMQWRALGAVVQMGHASAHRGHVPDVGDVSDGLDILERMLKVHYVDPRTAERLLQATPPRRQAS